MKCQSAESTPLAACPEVACAADRSPSAAACPSAAYGRGAGRIGIGSSAAAADNDLYRVLDGRAGEVRPFAYARRSRRKPPRKGPAC